MNTNYIRRENFLFPPVYLMYKFIFKITSLHSFKLLENLSIKIFKRGFPFSYTLY